MNDYRLGTSCEGPQGGSGGAGGMNTGINLGEMRFTWLLRQRSIPFCDEANTSTLSLVNLLRFSRRLRNCRSRDHFEESWPPLGLPIHIRT